jgi:hypothetical protein
MFLSTAISLCHGAAGRDEFVSMFRGGPASRDAWGRKIRTNPHVSIYSDVTAIRKPPSKYTGGAINYRDASMAYCINETASLQSQVDAKQQHVNRTN